MEWIKKADNPIVMQCLVWLEKCIAKSTGILYYCNSTLCMTLNGSEKIIFKALITSSLGIIFFIFQPMNQVIAQDSVLVSASKKYINSSPIRILFIGKNYRREWSTPVKMPVFHLKKQQGGFTIKELGGGQQTKSLRLLDNKGEEWVLRTTDKDVSKALEIALKNKLAVNIVKGIVQDLISASHPYASLTVPELAKAAGVIVAKPQLFFVPDDPAFGEYRKLFANTVCFLEDREPTPDQSETESTLDVMEKVIKENNHLLVQQSILRARLLDMLIADWDRHEDQWKWGVQKTGVTTFYYPVPKDRDFAYFQSNGFIILFASMTVLPHMHSFTNNGSALKRLSNKTWEMDAQWLNQLDAEEWKKTIQDFQNKLADSIIEKAVHEIPPEVYAISGKKLEKKLKKRRNGLLEHAMNYYRFLATQPYVIGTDEPEFFTIDADNKNILITVSRSATKAKTRLFTSEASVKMKQKIFLLWALAAMIISL